MNTTPTGPLSLFRARRAQRLARFLRLRRQKHLVAYLAVMIFGVTVVPVLVLWNPMCDRGKDDASRNQAFEIAKAATVFELQAGRPPTSVNELLEPPRPLTPIMEALPRDPWGADYLLVSPGVRGGARVTVVSAGPDGVFFTGDDVGNWQE